MNVVRLAEAKPYVAPKHSAGVGTMYLQHPTTGSEAPYWVGCSYYLPGSEAEWDATPLPKIYVVLDGTLVVATEDGEVELGPLDSCYLSPNERRQVRNETNRVATLLVAMPVPPQ